MAFWVIPVGFEISLKALSLTLALSETSPMALWWTPEESEKSQITF